MTNDNPDIVRSARRGWREGAKGRPPHSAHEDPPDLSPDPSTIFVSGRADFLVWSPEMRTVFNRFRRDALTLGLVPQEVELGEPRARRTWSAKRTPLDECFAKIEETPGVAFDDWARFCYPPLAEGAVGERAARKTAQVALSTLYRDGRVEKRYSATGVLHLFAVGATTPDGLENLTKVRPRLDYQAAAQQLRADLRGVEPRPKMTNFEESVRFIMRSPGVSFDAWATAFHPPVGPGEVARRAAREYAESSLKGMLRKNLVEVRYDRFGARRLFVFGAVLPEREEGLTRSKPSEKAIEMRRRETAAESAIAKKIAARPPELTNPPTDEEIHATASSDSTAESLEEELNSHGKE